MKKFDSYEQYKEITDNYRKNCIYKNVYFMKKQILQFVERKTLFYNEVEGNLYMYEKCEDFCRFYYYIGNESIYTDIQLDIPAVVEFVYKDEMTSIQAEEVKFLSCLGFERKRRSRRMVLPNASDFNFSKNECRENNINIRYAEGRDIIEIRNILLETFNPMFSFIPTEEELIEIINERRIRVASCNNEIVGVHHFEINKRMFMTWQLAIKSSYRKKGIGRQLFSKSHENLNNVGTCYIWVDVENVSAQRMYFAAGYEFDERCADEYVLGINKLKRKIINESC